MAARKPVKDVLVKLIVGAGQASPSPPVGPALGSKGVKSMDFCKEFNALTAHINPGTPMPVLITIRPDRTFHFIIRTPPTATLLMAAAGVPAGPNGKVKGANVPGGVSQSDGASADKMAKPTFRDGAVNHAALFAAKRAAGNKAVGAGGGSTQVGEVSLKHIYEIAKIKATEPRLAGLSLEGLVKSVVAQAKTIGVGVVP